MTVLIITHSRDNESISLVMEAIAARGKKAFRFDTDKFPTEVQLDVYYGRGTERLVLASDRGNLDLKDASAVWYRRVRTGARIPTEMNSQLRQASVLESRATIMGTIACLKGFHLDPVPNIRRAENKQLQLQVARELGLDTPRTLTTNNPKSAIEFARECQEGAIAKMLSSFAIYEEGQEKVVFTNPVTTEDLRHLEGLRFCPMTFQEKVPKALEVRTIIVGKQVFAAAVDSQQDENSHYDWRRRGIALLNAWKSYQLPQEVEEKLLKLMACFGLNYGAIDLILTPDGRHVFLEVNPVGEFFWLENCPGLPISQAIADILSDG
ncbi:MAG: MvdD family ATP-grasp ribosomal peptide maturase [Cyanosarcina radialis HA8281-LM2]|jgi:MvdD family ATP-grasp ribosomal peptide maturase|nr:MvdD family ATP-grasp ribosomal peptide maturase [Cyanosarcina radialis HA8281-LM2]